MLNRAPMKRSALVRKTPMRSGMSMRLIAAEDQPLVDSVAAPVVRSRAAMFTRRAVMAPVNDAVFAQPKTEVVRSEPYRRLVALLPCDLCGIAEHSQAAHPNTGKGLGTKTDDRLCFPLCADRPGVRGCHSQFDQGALMSRDERRVFEPTAGARTRAKIASLGLWPDSLPHLARGWKPEKKLIAP